MYDGDCRDDGAPDERRRNGWRRRDGEECHTLCATRCRSLKSATHQAIGGLKRSASLPVSKADLSSHDAVQLSVGITTAYIYHSWTDGLFRALGGHVGHPRRVIAQFFVKIMYYYRKEDTAKIDTALA
jgi:hypothetical protein